MLVLVMKEKSPPHFMPIDDRYFALWDIEIKTKSKDFAESINIDYFDYILNANRSKAKSDSNAAMAIKIAYHHSLETFFSLLGAYVQMPNAPYAWMLKYQTFQLKNVVRKIKHGDKTLLHHWHNLEVVNIESIADIIFLYFQPEKEKEKQKHIFIKAWKMLASEFLNEDLEKEYNSIKHGFRVQSGGTTLSIKLDGSEKASIVAHSEHGSRYYALNDNQLMNDINIQTTQKAINWHIESLICLFEITIASIQNIKSAIKIANSELGEKVEVNFMTLIEDEYYKYNGYYSSSDFKMNGFNLRVIRDENITPITKLQLKDYAKSWLDKQQKAFQNQVHEKLEGDKTLPDA